MRSIRCWTGLRGIFASFFDRERENTIQTWFSSLLWLLAAREAFRCASADTPPRLKFSFRLLGAGFLLFSVDETAMIHERTGDVVYRLIQQAGLNLHLTSSIAPVVLSPLAVAAGIWGFLAFRACFTRSSGSACCMGLGVGAVFLGGFVLDGLTNLLPWGEKAWLWQTEIILEETLEMLGVIMIFSGLIKYQESPVAESR